MTYLAKLRQELISQDWVNASQTVTTIKEKYYDSKVLLETTRFLLEKYSKLSLWNPGTQSTANHELPNSSLNTVEDPIEALNQIDLTESKILKPGLSALIRVKNGSRFIKYSIESIAPYVDEIVVADNKSDDNTIEIVKSMQNIYDNINLNFYNIDIPLVGNDHADAVKSGSKNTLGTFYNWTLSKANFYNAIKWDADFIGIGKNIKNMIELFNLRKRDDNFGLWFTGLASYNGISLNLNSWYDEFRAFSKLRGTRWTNYKGCETLGETIFKAEYIYIHGSGDNLKSVANEKLKILKADSPPIFIELKDGINLKPSENILDERDKRDNKHIFDFLNKPVDYDAVATINSSHILITIPGLSLGGGNYWAQLIAKNLDYLGIRYDITALQIHGNDARGTDKFYQFHNAETIFELNNENCKLHFSKYTHVLASFPLQFEEYLPQGAQTYIFSHSDVSYINNYALNSNYRAVGLNKSTLRKFTKKGKHCSILSNYLDIKGGINKLNSINDEAKLLYCNRISFDKNLLMVLHALALLKKSKPELKWNLKLLAGGCESSQIEYQSILQTIQQLDLKESITLKATQENVESFYLDHNISILASVSEGCSYGLLEAINYEIPIITAGIDANHELTQGKLPFIPYEKLNQLNRNLFCIENYERQLECLGYIITNDVIKLEGGKKAMNLLTTYYPFDTCTVYTPMQLQTIPNYIQTSDAVKAYANNQSIVFNENAKKTALTISDCIINYNAYKANIINLKQILHDQHFSPKTSRNQLYDLLFSSKIRFL